MPHDVDWSAQLWTGIDHGFRYLFFQTYAGWIAVAVALVAVGAKVVAERR